MNNLQQKINEWKQSKPYPPLWLTLCSSLTDGDFETFYNTLDSQSQKMLKDCYDEYMTSLTRIFLRKPNQSLLAFIEKQSMFNSQSDKNLKLELEVVQRV